MWLYTCRILAPCQTTEIVWNFEIVLAEPCLIVIQLIIKHVYIVTVFKLFIIVQSRLVMSLTVMKKMSMVNRIYLTKKVMLLLTMPTLVRVKMMRTVRQKKSLRKKSQYRIPSFLVSVTILCGTCSIWDQSRYKMWFTFKQIYIMEADLCCIICIIKNLVFTYCMCAAVILFR